MARCYFDGEECTCNHDYDCPRDTYQYQDDDGHEHVNIRDEHDVDYEAINQELMFDNFVWGM